MKQKTRRNYSFKHLSRKILLIPLTILVLFIVSAGVYVKGKEKESSPKKPAVKQVLQVQATPTHTPTPTVKTEKPSPNSTAPVSSKKIVYKIVMLGDSMTHALGPHGGTFNTFINDLYKKHNKDIIIDNYAVGSTNVLTIIDAMSKQVTYWDSAFEPMINQNFDLVLIESFGYNPLSQFPLEEGLRHQTNKLDEAIALIRSTHPNARIVFVATIAPNKENYGIKVNPNSTPADRSAQAEERIAYIKNHIAYGKSHNIPVVNIYERSLTAQGDGNLAYINPDDSIHPSFAGVDFIGREIANFIYYNNILPR